MQFIEFFLKKCLCRIPLRYSQRSNTMRVIMFDRQSLFIHGAIHSLQALIPEIDMTGTCQADDLWAQVSASPSAIVMIDGNVIQDDGIALLEEMPSALYS